MEKISDAVEFTKDNTEVWFLRYFVSAIFFRWVLRRFLGIFLSVVFAVRFCSLFFCRFVTRFVVVFFCVFAVGFCRRFLPPVFCCRFLLSVYDVGFTTGFVVVFSRCIRVL